MNLYEISLVVTLINYPEYFYIMEGGRNQMRNLPRSLMESWKRCKLFYYCWIAIIGIFILEALISLGMILGIIQHLVLKKLKFLNLTKNALL